MRIALVHDWLNGMRGGEKVFEVLCELFPGADVFTLFYEPDKVSHQIRAMHPRESPLAASFPAARRHYRYLLPLMPRMIEAIPLKGYDLIISTSHCVAKGVKPEPASTPHICYCFTPMRYVWEKYDDYFGRRISPASLAMPFFRKRLQRWDVESSRRVHHFFTSSNYVRERILRHYQREAEVIRAPVDVARFAGRQRDPQDYYLVVSALEPYKRIDIAVEAFGALGLPLRIAGTGSQMSALRRKAPANVEFLGWVDDDQLPELYSSAKALIFPADEDFGIVPLEASAAGCPVIAYGHGGALETIVDGVTGLFFSEQTAASLRQAVEAFGKCRFDPATLREHAAPFDRSLFKRRFKFAIEKILSSRPHEK